MSKTLSGEMSVEHVRRYIAERERRLQVETHLSESAEPEVHLQLLHQTNAKLDHLSINLERFREELSQFNRLFREKVESTRPKTEPTAPARPPSPPVMTAGAGGDHERRAGESTTPHPTVLNPTTPARPGDHTRRAGEPVTASPTVPHKGRWLARVVYMCTIVLLGSAAGLGYVEWKTSWLAQPHVTTERSVPPIERS